MSARRRRRDETGAVLVEFALVLPLLLCLIMGCFTGSLVYTDRIAENNAVREAVRYGAAADFSSPASSPTLWATSVRDRVKQTYFDSAAQTVTDDQICVELVQSTGTVAASFMGANCGTQPTLPTGMATGSCAVLVWMRRPETIKLAVFPSMTFQSSAQSVGYYSRVVKPTCSAS